MKNYKLLRYDEEELKEMGFYSNFHTIYKKRYCYSKPYGNIELVIAKGKEHIYFYYSNFLLPCELKDTIGEVNEKILKKEMALDLKELKSRGIISR